MAKRRNLNNMLPKFGLLGVLLLPQVKSSSGCHPHGNLMREEEKCIQELLLTSHKSAENSSSVQCTGMWDELNCWPHASLGETVSQPCPDFFGSDGEVHRNCTADGWTDPLIPHEDACGYAFNQTLHFLGESDLYFSYVKTMYTAGYTVSLVSLIIAVTIFCVFRKLHCTRNYIHIQLFTSFILRAIFIFIRDASLFTNDDLYHCDHYPVACKLVLMFSNYSILANYSWLLAEGHFLFTLVSRSFFSLRKHLAWYIVLSWGLPLIVIASWGCAKYFHEDEGCWETRRHEWIWWILRVPVLLSISYIKRYHGPDNPGDDRLSWKSMHRLLFVRLDSEILESASHLLNLLFFLGVLRILVSKLRMPDAQRNEFRQYRRLIKSTFFLVALFGLHYILFVFLPVEVSSSVFKIWTIVELGLSSTQGFVVAVLYCFMNGEVQHEVQRRWKRWRLNQRMPNQQRRHHQRRGSISQSGSPPTQVSLLPCSPATGGFPVDSAEA